MAITEITFEDLLNNGSAFVGQQIFIRGFLYVQDDGTQILAGEPHMKSCCLGAKDKMGSQLMILGLPPSPSLKVQQLEGVLLLDSQGNYYLSKASLAASSFSGEAMVGIILVTIFFGIIFKKKLCR